MAGSRDLSQIVSELQGDRGAIEALTPALYAETVRTGVPGIEETAGALTGSTRTVARGRRSARPRTRRVPPREDRR